ncbi:type II secretion system protein [Campylobacter pinnipediorum]|uniref:Type II secretion system protein n=3 Tax=Campylobacter TaxID=194 RepID=A0AAX0LBD7_9BACT|nr:type II secretion system protein [Campylobacter pinnipediorum]AQW83138.1 putative type II secretion system protein [Campylobacter pinnipediorum subsp. pinnipediorum]AQW84705.1 putative type II secretion system protein [Campylobacter pinnipediorum subsp. pinnipediorum]OPA79570.1 hypothetical protein BFG05_00235 [Campylobacter pinnipediorum subsp. pinnipediorum]OPA81825.1 hypothetical protein BFG04_01405 [Campylobacter pinnipediorum subsp. pinnipediorum]
MKKAFTMIELVFIITIIGILSGVAIMKMNFGRTDAEIQNAKVQLASVKSAIMVYYNDKLLFGKPKYPETLDKDGKLFGSILPMGGIKPSTGKNGWKIIKPNEEYTFTVSGRTVKFKYKKADGKLTCEPNHDTTLCSQLE